MNAENSLIDKFYTGFWFLLIGLIWFLVFLIISVIFKKKLTNDGKNIPRFILIIVILIALIVFCIAKVIPYFQDLNNVQNHKFEYITGKVVGYGKATSVGDIATDIKYTFPIIEDDKGDLVELDVPDTVLNETYTFVYLKHTKLAVIV